MARVDRRKRFNLTDATPVEQRPQIWVDGRQQPRFKIGPYVTVSLAIAKRDLLPDMIATEARLRLYGEKVRHGEIRPNLAWAGRFAEAMPQAETVAGWIFSMADVYAGARARLEGGHEEGLGEDGQIAYPGLLKSQARPRKVRPSRNAAAMVESPGDAPRSGAETETGAEAALKAALAGGAGSEPQPTAFQPDAGPDIGATPADSAALGSGAGDAPLFPEPGFLAEALLAATPAATAAPLAGATAKEPAAPASATEAEAEATPQDSTATGRKAGKRSRRAARMTLDDEILAFDMVFQGPAAQDPEAAPAETAAPEATAAFQPEAAAIPDSASALDFEMLFQVPQTPETQAAPVETTAPEVTSIPTEASALDFDTVFQTPSALETPPQPAETAETPPTDFGYDATFAAETLAPRLDAGLEDVAGFWLADDGEARGSLHGLMIEPDSLPVEFPLLSSAEPLQASAAPAEVTLASLAFDPDVLPEDGLEQGSHWAGLPPSFLADPLPDADLPGLDGAEATMRDWSELDLGGGEVEQAGDPTPAVSPEVEASFEAVALDESATAASLSPEEAIRGLFAELDASAPLVAAQEPGEAAAPAEPEIDPDLTAIRMAMGDLLIRTETPAEVAAETATAALALAPTPATPQAQVAAPKAEPAPALSLAETLPEAPRAALDAEALGDTEALARDKTALARMLAGLEDLPDTEALQENGPWGAPNAIRTVIARPAARPRKTPLVVRMAAALARGIGRTGRAIGRGISQAASGLVRASLALTLACGRGALICARGTARAARPILRPILAWGGRATHVSACWTLLVLLMATALPGGAVKAMIFHLDGGDLSDWS